VRRRRRAQQALNCKPAAAAIRDLSQQTRLSSWESLTLLEDERLLVSSIAWRINLLHSCHDICLENDVSDGHAAMHTILNSGIANVRRLLPPAASPPQMTESVPCALSRGNGRLSFEAGFQPLYGPSPSNLSYSENKTVFMRMWRHPPVKVWGLLWPFMVDDGRQPH